MELTIRDLAESDEALQALETFDYAIPIGWVDDVKAKTGEYPEHFVWAYRQGSIWGEPWPLTPEAEALLRRYNAVVTR